MQESKRLDLMQNATITRALIKLGVPTMIGMLMTAMNNVIDSYFVGQLGTNQLAAVSIVFPVSMAVTGLGLLFGSGGSSYLARLLGAKKYDKVKECASTTLITGITVSAIVVACQLIFFEPLMKMLGATDSIMPYVKEYGYIFILSLFLNIFNVIINNMITAEGASTFSMMAMLLGGICNAIADPVFIFGFHMGITGAALSTLSTRALTFLLYIYYLKNGKSMFCISIKNFHPSKKMYFEILKIGFPIMMFQFLSGAAIGLTNVSAKPFGEEMIAAMSIVSRIISLEVMAMFGFMKGYQAFVGYNFGAKKDARIQSATKMALIWSTVFCILMGVMCITFSGPMIHMFNKDSAFVYEMGRKALLINSLSTMTLGIQVVYGSYFLAIGKAREGGILSLCRQGAFFIPLILILPRLLGINGLLAVQPIADFLSVIVTLYFVIKNLKKANHLPVNESTCTAS